MTGPVLDASAVLALVHSEPGGRVVQAAAAGAAISTVNWSEVCRRATERGADVAGLRGELSELGLEFVVFDAVDAEAAAALWPETRHAGLSLADRACLALGRRLGRPVLTADRSWLELDLGVDVQAIR